MGRPLTWAQRLPRARLCVENPPLSCTLRLVSLENPKQPVSLQVSRDANAQEIPLHGGDVAPHVHGVPDGTAMDVLDGHRVSLRDKNVNYELGHPQWAPHLSPEQRPGPPRPIMSPSRHCLHVTSFFS